MTAPPLYWSVWIPAIASFFVSPTESTSCSVLPAASTRSYVRISARRFRSPVWTRRTNEGERAPAVIPERLVTAEDRDVPLRRVEAEVGLRRRLVELDRDAADVARVAGVVGREVAQRRHALAADDDVRGGAVHGRGRDRLCADGRVRDALHTEPIASSSAVSVTVTLDLFHPAAFAGGAHRRADRRLNGVRDREVCIRDVEEDVADRLDLDPRAPVAKCGIVTASEPLVRRARGEDLPGTCPAVRGQTDLHVRRPDRRQIGIRLVPGDRLDRAARIGRRRVRRGDQERARAVGARFSVTSAELSPPPPIRKSRAVSRKCSRRRRRG